MQEYVYHINFTSNFAAKHDFSPLVNATLIFYTSLQSIKGHIYVVCVFKALFKNLMHVSMKLSDAYVFKFSVYPRVCEKILILWLNESFFMNYVVNNCRKWHIGTRILL